MTGIIWHGLQNVLHKIRMLGCCYLVSCKTFLFLQVFRTDEFVCVYTLHGHADGITALNVDEVEHTFPLHSSRSRSSMLHFFVLQVAHAVYFCKFYLLSMKECSNRLKLFNNCFGPIEKHSKPKSWKQSVRNQHGQPHCNYLLTSL